MAAGLYSDSVSGFGGTLEIRPLHVDELSSVRYIHATSLRGQAGGCYTAEELDAFEAMVRSVRYAETIMKDTLIGGWIGHELIGTAAWGLVDDSGRTARIASVFVRPFFTGMGVGHRLVSAAETLASKAGYRSYSVRTTLNAVAFFEQLGYAIASYGTRPLSPDIAMAVAFMRKDTGAGAPANDAA